ncbi:MAG: hypothetical protein WCW78_02680 [Candidatus Paceibacterota bacterium]|jgi:hypothetical protein
MKAFFFTSLMALFCATTFAQQQDELQLKSIATSIGKGALSSGYDISINFGNESNGLQVTGNHTRVYAAYRWQMPYITLGATGGFFKNAPWVGPQIIFTPASFISTVHWYGFAGGAPEHPDWKINKMIHYNAVTLRVSGIALTYAVSKFMNDNADQLPGVSYTGKVNASWNYTIGTDYTVNGREPLFQLGLKHIF